MITVIAAIFAIVGGAYSSVWFLDGRYAPLDAVEDLAWSQLKREIRDIRQRIRQAQSDEVVKSLELDLDDTIDRLCRNYPNDRECRRRRP